jgi:hypothetical protein
LLRPPRRWKRAEFKIGDQAVRTVVATKAGEPRQRNALFGRTKSD